MFVLMCVPLTRDRSRNPLAPLRFARGLPNRSLRFWAESGAGSDPPPIVRSTAPESELMFGLISVVRGRSQPAPAARMIPAGRLRTRLRQVQAAAGDGFGRRMVLDADEGIEAPLTEVVFDLGDQLPDVGEPEGLRRAGGGLVRPLDAGGNHNGAPLCQERTGAGVRGRRPRSATCSGSGARGRGFRRGASPPSPAPVFNTGYAGLASSSLPARALLPAAVALVTTVTRAHGGTAVVMPRAPVPHLRSRPGTRPTAP